MNGFTCPKCGSHELIPDVQIIDHGHSNMRMDLSATIFKHPDAVFFKGPVVHRFKALVCGQCGFTEFYVENAPQLLAVAKDASRLS
jgi:predicted nucleic-acid-binding Zn-ribbon protein